RNYYENFYESQMDFWNFFVKKSIDLLKGKGLLGYITSRYFITAAHSINIRKYINNNCNISQLIDFGESLVFNHVGVHTCVFILNKYKDINNKIKYIRNPNPIINKGILEIITKGFQLVNQSNLTEAPWEILDNESKNILDRIKSNSIRLDEICIIGTGIKSGYDDIFVISQDEIKDYNIEKGILRLWVKNSDIRKYHINYNDKYVIYAYKDIDMSKYPNALAYLTKNKKELTDKWVKRNEDFKFYDLYRAREYLFFDTSNEILCPYKSKTNNFCINDNNYCGSGDIYAIKIKDENGKYRIKYILSLLNSKLFNYVYKKIGKEKGGLLEFYTEPLSKLPIYSIKKNDNNSIQTHDRLVSLVDSMLETQKEFHNAKSDNDKRTI
ncbi:MAG: TaqI-like C-terminal specificity domain-containing protein, partial [Brevinematales bacterium]